MLSIGRQRLADGAAGPTNFCSFYFLLSFATTEQSFVLSLYFISSAKIGSRSCLDDLRTVPKDTTVH
jgi:hypothetical protein